MAVILISCPGLASCAPGWDRGGDRLGSGGSAQGCSPVHATTVLNSAVDNHIPVPSIPPGPNVRKLCHPSSCVGARARERGQREALSGEIPERASRDGVGWPWE